MRARRGQPIRGSVNKRRDPPAAAAARGATKPRDHGLGAGRSEEKEFAPQSFLQAGWLRKCEPIHSVMLLLKRSPTTSTTGFFSATPGGLGVQEPFRCSCIRLRAGCDFFFYRATESDATIRATHGGSASCSSVKPVQRNTLVKGRGGTLRI